MVPIKIVLTKKKKKTLIMVLTMNSLHTSMFSERLHSDIRNKKNFFYTNYKNKIFAVINRNIIKGDNIAQFCLGMGWRNTI